MTAATKEKPKASARGLGKGLSALMSESYSSPVSAREDIPFNDGSTETLLLDDIQPGKYQPRDHFDQVSLHELAESIRRNGVVQPILVRQIGGGKFEIIAGERRWRAAGIAGLRAIPATVRELDDKKALELALVENVQREDLNPLEEAAGYQRLIADFSYTQEELAATVHKSRSHIANLMRLLELPEEIRHLLAENKLSMGHARALAGVPGNVALAYMVVEKGLNVRQAEKLARAGKGISEPRERKPRQQEAPAAAPVAVQPAAPAVRDNAHRDPDIMALEETLSENLGLKVSINDHGQSGAIVIAYDSLEQLDEILRRLGGSI
jgi:ParB family chromosome partitioning protein